MNTHHQFIFISRYKIVVVWPCVYYIIWWIIIIASNLLSNNILNRSLNNILLYFITYLLIFYHCLIFIWLSFQCWSSLSFNLLWIFFRLILFISSFENSTMTTVFTKYSLCSWVVNLHYFRRFVNGKTIFLNHIN